MSIEKGKALPVAALLVKTDNDGYHLFHGDSGLKDYMRDKKVVKKDYGRPDGWVPKVEEKDKLVRKQDAEEAIKEAREEERQKILNKLEDIEERFHTGDKVTSGILDPSDLVTEVLETVEEEVEE